MARSSWGYILTVLPMWLHIVCVLGAFPMIEDNTGTQGYVKWPNREIKYCYETKEAREKYHKDLMNAWQIWLATGLSDAFKVTEVDDDTCTNDQANTMLVYDSDTGPDPRSVLATMPGFLGAGNRARATSGYYPRKNRPVMLLTNHDDIGMLNPIFNYAHEWGHAWGLHHEHQNPNFWAGVVGATSGKVFGYGNKVEYNGKSIDNWQCNSLRDYSRIEEKMELEKKQGAMRYTIDDLCRAQDISRKFDFSGYDYLPFRENVAKGSTGHKSKDVDWQSMMMYNSKAGGSGTARLDDDQRLPILLQPDGTLIPFNYAPTPQDIDALETLYGLSRTKQSLLQKIGGATSSKFNALFSESKGESSTSSCL